MASTFMVTQKSSGLLARTLLFAALAVSACAPRPAATPFVPPTGQLSLPTQAAPASPVSSSPTAPALTATLPPSTPTPCSNGLSFIQDVTIQDGTAVQPGQRIDKQWLVSNSGSCNWDASYRIKLIRGDALGAAEQQALFPARAGLQVTLRIAFTAPEAGGSYQGTWQAIAPDGSPFGDPLSIRIAVTP